MANLVPDGARHPRPPAIQEWLLPVYEQLQGASLGALAADRLEGLATERTVRNWLSRSTEPRGIDVDGLRGYMLQNFHRELAAPHWNWSREEAQQLTDRLRQQRGPLGAFMTCMDFYSGGRYVAACERAAGIDFLYARLDDAIRRHAPGDFRRTMLESPIVDSDHWRLISDVHDGAHLERLAAFSRADSWDELWLTAHLPVVNVVIEFLTILDHEMRLNWFAAPGIERTPLFCCLLPLGIDEAASKAPAVRRRERDRWTLPQRRLVDLLGCLDVRNRMRAWPARIPSVHEMARRMDVSPRQVMAWRHGRPLTNRQFSDLWTKMMTSGPDSLVAPVPSGLLLAALVWARLFVRGRTDRDLRPVLVPEDGFYRFWWERVARMHTVSDRPAGPGSWVPAALMP